MTPSLHSFPQILAFATALFTATRTTEYECTWKHNNASFDLCDWQKTSDSQGNGYWEVYDDRDAYYNNYTYQFNVCADIASTDRLNPLCLNNTLREIRRYPLGYCTNIVNATTSNTAINQCECLNSTNNGTQCIQEAISSINIKTAAYQMPRKRSNDACYRLHDGVTPPIFSLIDDSDPTIGVSIKYIGGDWCAKYGKNREFIINFYCSNNHENEPDKTEKISEPSNEDGVNGGCSYVLEIDSTIGCPLECPLINEQLCSGNGICQYDESNMQPKCFCYKGWFGEDCSSNVNVPTHIELKHSDGKYIALLIVIVIVLTILLLIVIYLAVRIYQVKYLNAGQVGSEEDIMVDDMNHSQLVGSIQGDSSKKHKIHTSKQPLAKQGLLNQADHPIVV